MFYCNNRIFSNMFFDWLTAQLQASQKPSLKIPVRKNIEDTLSLIHPMTPLTEKMPLQWHHNGQDGASNHQPTIIYPTVYSGADHRKRQSFGSLAFVRGIHRWPANSPQRVSNAENVSIWRRHPACYVEIRFSYQHFYNAASDRLISQPPAN